MSQGAPTFRLCPCTLPFLPCRLCAFDQPGCNYPLTFLNQPCIAYADHTLCVGDTCSAAAATCSRLKLDVSCFGALFSCPRHGRRSMQSLTPAQIARRRAGLERLVCLESFLSFYFIRWFGLGSMYCLRIRRVLLVPLRVCV